jgi:hypothetical protein
MKRVANRRHTTTAKANSIPVTLADGTLDTSFFGATGTLGYSLNVTSLTTSPLDSETRYLGSLPRVPSTTAALDKVYIPSDGTIEIAQIFCSCSGASTNEAWSFYVRLNDTTDYLIATVSNASQDKVFTNLAMALDVVAGDYFQIKHVTPAWVTNPGGVAISGHVYITETS